MSGLHAWEVDTFLSKLFFQSFLTPVSRNLDIDVYKRLKGSLLVLGACLPMCMTGSTLFYAAGTSVPCARMIHQWCDVLLLPNWVNLQKFWN